MDLEMVEFYGAFKNGNINKKHESVQTMELRMKPFSNTKCKYILLRHFVH